MTTIVTRAGKGSALTWTEGDANITNLNNDKIEAVVDDTTPQLGGDLDVNGNKITATSGNIELDPGTGSIVLGNETWPSSSGGGSPVTGTVTDSDAETDQLTLSTVSGLSNDQAITFTGTGLDSVGLSLGTTYYITNVLPATTGITISTSIGGATYAVNTVVGVSDVNFSASSGSSAPTTGQVLTYGTGGELSWTTPTTGSTSLSTLTDVTISGSPTSGQVLTYDTGTSKWTNQNASSGGYPQITDDTTTNATRYVLFDNATSGDADSINVSSSKLTFNPSTGRLTATGGLTVGSSISITSGGISITSGGISASGITVGKDSDQIAINTYSGTQAKTTPFNGDGYGMEIRFPAKTWAVTSASGGTKVAAYISTIGSATLTHSTATTYTDASTFHISGAPIASTNTTFTNAWALSAGGKIKATDFVGDINGNTWPSGAGTSGQVLTTDGTGTLSWSTVSGGGGSGTVTSVSGTGTVNGITLTGTVTDSGSLTLGGTLSNVSLTSQVTGILPVANGGLGTTSLQTFQSTLEGMVTTATSAGTLALSSTSVVNYQFTGTNTHSVTLPATFAVGRRFNFINNSTGTITITTDGTSVLCTIPGGVTCTVIGLVANTTWDFYYSGFNGITGTGNLVRQANAVIDQPSIQSASISASTYSGALSSIRETVYALTYGATLTPNAANGSVQTVTLTGSVTINAFTSPVSGQTITLILTQDATGSRTLTSTMKFAGGAKTLSTAANAIDILTISYIGTTYYASLSKGFA